MDDETAISTEQTTYWFEATKLFRKKEKKTKGKVTLKKKKEWKKLQLTFNIFYTGCKCFLHRSWL
jgi:hypothetical protein